jgi:ERF superfamily protein
VSAQAIEITEHRNVAALTPITPMAMLAQAIERGMPVETVDKLMALSERWDATQARKAFDMAIAAAKAEIPVVTKNAKGHNDKKYADFAAIARAVDPVISRHGLSYRFRTVQTDNKINVTCVLSHEAGHYEENTLSALADTSGNKNAIQSIGSTLTYLQRYSLVQALGIAASEDDDGRASASGGVISADEVASIREVLDLIGDASVEPRMLKWLKVEKVEDIPSARYDDAMDNLKKVKRS